MKNTKKELVEKIGMKNLALIEHNAYCGTCSTTTIVGYEDGISVMENGDIVLNGVCKHCDKKVARVIETGDE